MQTYGINIVFFIGAFTEKDLKEIKDGKEKETLINNAVDEHIIIKEELAILRDMNVVDVKYYIDIKKYSYEKYQINLDMESTMNYLNEKKRIY